MSNAATSSSGGDITHRGSTPQNAPAGRFRSLLLRRNRGVVLEAERGPAFFDSFLFLMVICAMLLPTTAGYELATAAAHSIVGLPFAVMMFLSPFAVMALLPLRLLQLMLDGVFGIRLRLSLLAPLALVCLAIFFVLGPLNFRPMPASMAIGTTPEMAAAQS